MNEEKQKVNEAVRMIRWRMAHEEFRWSKEIGIIPGWLGILAIGLFVIGQVAAQIVHFFNPTQGPMIAYVGAAAGVTLGLDVLLLFFGYVNRDAQRRGMNATLWTLLAIFVPYLIGVIIYFLVREPLAYNCPQCGASVSARFNYCSKCKFNLRPACPHCQREVHLDDKFCPYCSRELMAEQARTGS
jgi:endogenous inhibitor of DNA gyrase (YacG/DUF329 family)